MEKETLLDLDFIKESNPVKQCLAIKTNKEKCDAHTIGEGQYCKRHLNLINKHKKKKQKYKLKSSNEIIKPLLDKESNTKQSTNNNNTFNIDNNNTYNNDNNNTFNIDNNNTYNNADKSDTLNLINNKEENVKTQKKKRGRRRKIDISDNFYNKDYLTVWPEIIDGKKLLIDNDNNVYTFDLENPVYLGKKTLNCKIVKL